MALRQWSQTASGNASVAGINWSEGQAPSTVNNSAREMEAQVRQQYTPAQWHWVEISNTASVATQTTFKVSTDLTSAFHANRRVRLSGGSTTRYASVVSSSFTAETTVTVTVDSGSLSASHTIAAMGPAATSSPVGGFAPTTATASFTSDVQIAGHLFASATASFGSDVTVAGHLAVSATASFVGAVTMAATLGVSATASFGGVVSFGGNPSGNITSGTYTPTLFNTTNIDASTAYSCQYLRVGSVVTVSGQTDVDTTAGGGTDTFLGISLPVASNFANPNELGGTAACLTTLEACAINADATNDRALMRWPSQGTNNRSFYFSFTYRII